jgi:hypothetical protein
MIGSHETVFSMELLCLFQDKTEGATLWFLLFPIGSVVRLLLKKETA